MTRSGQRALTAVILAAALLAASDASARTERFRWTQVTTVSVTSFKIYWGLGTGSYSSSLNVGLPSKDATGAYFYDLVVNDADNIFVVVSALNGTLESVRSNEISRLGISGGGTVTPPPTGGTASAGIVGFALWNALNETVVDANFSSGDSISDAIRNCASIEIKTNAYLSASGAGSVKKVFDGVDNGCSGTGVENSAPYAWEDGGTAGQFACAPSLAAIGSHTLKVTPYDGDNCSGAVGTPVTLTFSVAGPATAACGTLGAPGQPYIVP
jgi:hypothetical protein